MLYFVVVTHACNLSCSYCGSRTEDNSAATTEIRYEIKDLGRFMAQDPDSTIVFYGGEPLTRVALVKQIMDRVPAQRLILQTNALKLKDLSPEYTNRLSAVLVSIDGRKETTDNYRGEGTYDSILDNLKAIRQNGFKGDLVARMTASEQTDIFLDVTHLLELRDPSFDHVHWQIDALWDSPPDLRWGNFDRWITGCYDPGIAKLVRLWGGSMTKLGKILPIVPFNGVMSTLLDGKSNCLRCGAGIDSFAVTISGDLTVCPIAPEWEFAKVGTIFDNKPCDLPGKVRIGAPCTECTILNICGGRCLFANKTKLWGEHGFQRICRSTSSMITELASYREMIADLISRGGLSRKEFDYAPYNNGTEIIP